MESAIGKTLKRNFPLLLFLGAANATATVFIYFFLHRKSAENRYNTRARHFGLPPRAPAAERQTLNLILIIPFVYTYMILYVMCYPAVNKTR